MKIRCVWLSVVLLLTTTNLNKLSAQSESVQSSNEDSRLWRVERDIAADTLGALGDPDASAALDKARFALEKIDRLRSMKAMPLSKTIPAAEAAFLLSAPRKAIEILEKAMREHPNEEPPVPNVTFPIDVIGNFWIGTFARHSGDVARAETAYRDILSRSKDSAGIKYRSMLSAICYLYLAEIEVQSHKNPDKAAALLKELASLPKPNDKQGDLVLDVYKAWGQHMLNAMTPRSSSVMAFPIVKPPYNDPSFVPNLHMAIVGLGDPGELSVLAGESDVDIYKCSLERIVKSEASPTDTALAQLMLGGYYVMGKKKDLAKAREYFEALFKGNSYYAPEGGIALARCWHQDNKLDQAQRILEELGSRFPAYKRRAEILLQQLSTNPKPK